MLFTILFGAFGGLVVGVAVAYLFKWKRIAPAAIGGVLIASVGAAAFMGGSLDLLHVEGPQQFYTQVLQAQTPVVVDFYSETCIACKMLAPTLESLSKEYDQRVKFVKVEITESPGLVESYRISGTPTVILFVEGAPVGKWLGNQPAEAYRDLLDKTLAGKLMLGVFGGRITTSACL